MIIGKGINRAMEGVSYIVNLKTSNRENLLGVCGCAPETLVMPSMSRGTRKVFLANGMIGEHRKHCPSFVSMMKTVPRRLSPQTLEIVNFFDVIKKSHEEFNTKGRIDEEAFNELNVPQDADSNRETQIDLRSSDFMPLQRS